MVNHVRTHAMLIAFPPAPELEGLSYLSVTPVFFTDHGSGERRVFPLYRYRDEETGELVLVSEDHFAAIFDRMIASGIFNETEEGA